jgi:hypothetical protein
MPCRSFGVSLISSLAPKVELAKQVYPTDHFRYAVAEKETYTLSYSIDRKLP